MKFRLACIAAASLIVASCATISHTTPQPSPVPPPQPVVVCRDCGQIERVEVVRAVQATQRGGVVLGGLVGGVVSGESKNRPAVAANKPQATYRLTLRMEDGRRLVLHQNVIPAALRAGSKVRLVDGRITLIK